MAQILQSNFSRLVITSFLTLCSFFSFGQMEKPWMTELNEDEFIGASIIGKAILAPLKRIAENAGLNGSVIIEQVLREKFEIGYNAALNKFEDLYKNGIVDPAKVTRSGLQNANSIASMILTTECIIVDETEK